MYTFLINEDNTITASLTERIMQRSKLVDNLHFLADQTYKGVDISDYTVMLQTTILTLPVLATSIFRQVALLDRSCAGALTVPLNGVTITTQLTVHLKAQQVLLLAVPVLFPPLPQLMQHSI